MKQGFILHGISLWFCCNAASISVALFYWLLLSASLFLSFTTHTHTHTHTCMHAHTVLRQVEKSIKKKISKCLISTINIFISLFWLLHLSMRTELRNYTTQFGFMTKKCACNFNQSSTSFCSYLPFCLLELQSRNSWSSMFWKINEKIHLVLKK